FGDTHISDLYRSIAMGHWLIALACANVLPGNYKSAHMRPVPNESNTDFRYRFYPINMTTGATIHTTSVRKHAMHIFYNTLAKIWTLMKIVSFNHVSPRNSEGAEIKLHAHDAHGSLHLSKDVFGLISFFLDPSIILVPSTRKKILVPHVLR
ncbi:hypothetical protein ACJX0J_007841, partial [Zea mays]